MPRKKARKSCTFHPESNIFTWAISSGKGPPYARCTVCNHDVCIPYGDTKDLKKHELTREHQASHNSLSGSTSLTSYFGMSRPGLVRDQVVIVAEVQFGYFLGE